MKAQIRAYQGVIEKWHSSPDYFYIGGSIDADNCFPAVLPSAFSEMEVRVNAIKNTVVEKIRRSKTINSKKRLI